MGDEGVSGFALVAVVEAAVEGGAGPLGTGGQDGLGAGIQTLVAQIQAGQFLSPPVVRVQTLQQWTRGNGPGRFNLQPLAGLGLERKEPNVLGRFGGSFRPQPPPALAGPHAAPVGSQEAMPGELTAVGEGLDEHRTHRITVLPIVGQIGQGQPQDLGNQIGATDLPLTTTTSKRPCSNTS